MRACVYVYPNFDKVKPSRLSNDKLLNHAFSGQTTDLFFFHCQNMSPRKGRKRCAKNGLLQNCSKALRKIGKSFPNSPEGHFLPLNLSMLD